MALLFRAVWTGTRPGLIPAIRAGKGWRGRRELAPRCSATQLGASRWRISTERVAELGATAGMYGQTHTHQATRPDHHHHHHHTGSDRLRCFCVASLFVLAVDIMLNVERVTTGSARRRRERRLRSMLRHERMSVAMALAERLHHSADVTYLGKKELVEHAQYNAPRGQKTARAVGGRPAPLPEVAGWQGRLEQHVLEDLGSICPSVQILDLPVLQVVEQPEEVDSFFRNFVPAVAEQVIEVPKLALPSCAVQRAVLSEPQTAEQLVEVPTPLFYSLLQLRTAEHFIGIAVPRLGGGAFGGPQGFFQGQGSSAVSGADNVGSTVSGRGGGARGGLHGLSQGQGSTAVSGAEQVVTPVPLGRGGGARGGLQGLSQGQGSFSGFVEQTGLSSGFWSSSR